MNRQQDSISDGVSYFGWHFWVHRPLVIIANLSFLLFSYQLIMVGMILLFVEYYLFDGCVLTNMQLGKESKGDSFYTLYFDMLNIGIDKRKFNFYMDYVHPFAILLLSIVLNIWFSYTPFFDVNLF